METDFIESSFEESPEILFTHATKRSVEMDMEILPESLLQQTDVCDRAVEPHQRIAAGDASAACLACLRFLDDIFRSADQRFIRPDKILVFSLFAQRAEIASDTADTGDIEHKFPTLHAEPASFCELSA